MKTVYLILGSIGSGKSVVADFLLSDHTFDNIEYAGSDMYKTQYFDYDVSVDKSGYRCADELMFYRVEHICKSDNDFVLEFCPTNLNKIETVKYILRNYNYNVVTFFVCTESRDINVSRCKSREGKGADQVPEAKIKSRYDDVLNRAIEIVDLSDKTYFIDNSKDVPKVVAFLGEEQLIVLDGSCVWFTNNIEKKLIYLEEKSNG